MNKRQEQLFRRCLVLRSNSRCKHPSCREWVTPESAVAGN